MKISPKEAFLELRSFRSGLKDQMEGIENAQDAAKKEVKGKKQNKIESTKKSKQNLKNQLKRHKIDNVN